MDAGRELDVLVAEKVMGWTLCDRKANGWGDGPPVWSTGEDPDDDRSSPTYQDFRPSSDIADAWRVVNKFKDAECFSLGWSTKGAHVRCYILLEAAPKCKTEEEVKILDMQLYGWHYADADTAPLAICLAALKAVGAEVPS